MKLQAHITASSCISAQHNSGVEGLPAEWQFPVTAIHEVQRPDYVRYIDPRQVRRMGKSVRLALCAANLCVDQAHQVPDAIITATGLGSMGSTEKFITQVLENDEENLIPYAFLQTTFNTSGAQIALQHQITDYNMTWVHKGIGFEWALIDAITLLESGEASRVLCGGFDEMTTNHAHVMSRAGLSVEGEVNTARIFAENHPIPGEGAGFFMLEPHGDGPKITSVNVHTGTISEEVVRGLIERSLQESGWDAPDLILSGENGLPAHDLYLANALNTYSLPQARFKHLCGEFETCTAFAVWLATHATDVEKINALVHTHLKLAQIPGKVLIVNQYSDDNLGVIALEL